MVLKELIFHCGWENMYHKEYDSLALETSLLKCLTV